MFDVSCFEILVVLAASCYMLGVKGTIDAVKSVKRFALNIQDSFSEYVRFLENETKTGVEEDDNLLDAIIDIDGNLQKRYNLSKIMPEIKGAKNE